MDYGTNYKEPMFERWIYEKLTIVQEYIAAVGSAGIQKISAGLSQFMVRHYFDGVTEARPLCLHNDDTPSGKRHW